MNNQINILKISYRNLKRNHRRTLLTASLITLGVVFVLVYTAMAGSFKGYMVGQITDSMMGHLQIHKKSFTSYNTTIFDMNSIKAAFSIVK